MNPSRGQLGRIRDCREIHKPSVARTRNRSVDFLGEGESVDRAGIERVLCVTSGFAVTYGGVLRAPGHRRISPPMNALESLGGSGT